MRHLGSPPLVCLITTGESNSENYPSQSRKIVDVVRAAVDDGISIVQIREKQLPVRLLCELAREVVGLARGSLTRVLINDRVDIALAAGADGVHLPEASFRPAVVRASFGGEFIIGKSVHSINGARDAVEDGVDYILFGPVFETPGKGPSVGLERLREVCNAVTATPIIALGGIDDRNCKQAIDAGAAGIAAIRSLHDPDRRRRIIDALL